MPDPGEMSTTLLCVSSGFTNLNKAAAKSRGVGLIAEAVADRLVSQVDVHVPSTEPLIEVVKNTHQLVIQRQGHLIRIIPIDLLSYRHGASFPPDRNVLSLFSESQDASSG